MAAQGKPLETKYITIAFKLLGVQLSGAVTKQWYALGLLLLPDEIGEELLSDVGENKNNDFRPPYLRMLEAWIRHSGDASWSKLLEALRTLDLGDVSADDLADAIEKWREDPADKTTGNLRKELQKFHIHDTGKLKKLESGAFSDPVQYEANGVLMTGKSLSNERVIISDQKKFHEGCSQIFTLRHPNIVQFCGVHFLANEPLPIVLTENLNTILYSYLQCAPSTPFAVKLSIFIDVARGLAYLHNRPLKIAHLGLTTKCVLLDGSLTAKIGNFLSARFIDHANTPQEEDNARKKGELPEHLPLEESVISTALDVFSLGHLMLCVCTQSTESLSSAYCDAQGKMVPNSEVIRRHDLFMKFKGLFRDSHPLDSVIHDCLACLAERRPKAEDVTARLEPELQRRWLSEDFLEAIRKGPLLRSKPRHQAMPQSIDLGELEDSSRQENEVDGTKSSSVGTDRGGDIVSDRQQSPAPRHNAGTQLPSNVDSAPDLVPGVPPWQVLMAKQKPASDVPLHHRQCIASIHPSYDIFERNPKYSSELIPLSIKDLKYVVEILVECRMAEKWEAIGNRLTVRELHAIKSKHEGDSQLCIIVMLADWLNGQYDRKADPPCGYAPCLFTLVWVVADPDGGHNKFQARKMIRKWQYIQDQAPYMMYSQIPLYHEDVDDIDPLAGQLKRQLSEVAIRWFHIGILLGLSYSSLQIIAAESKPPDQCLLDMITQWLTNFIDPIPTLQEMACVIAHIAGGNNSMLSDAIVEKWKIFGSR